MNRSVSACFPYMMRKNTDVKEISRRKNSETTEIRKNEDNLNTFLFLSFFFYLICCHFNRVEKGFPYCFSFNTVLVVKNIVSNDLYIIICAINNIEKKNVLVFSYVELPLGKFSMQKKNLRSSSECKNEQLFQHSAHVHFLSSNFLVII